MIELTPPAADSSLTPFPRKSAERRKLIEVSLPLEAINRESAREKSIRHGHPSTLHLWWARRPLAAARAVLFSQLVDDPSSRPEEFPTEETQRAERERLHELIRKLVVWENTKDEGLLRQAREEILKSTGGNPPPILDPFAGGGTIPLEAQRLGLEAHASDLNPVAVLINKALIEIPPKFAGQPPVAPGVAATKAGWSGAEGLAADVRAYGEWMREQARERIGHLYPDATLPNGDTAPVIAWIWARTVRCPNPACGIEMPLVRSWWLGKKKGKEAYVIPTVVDDPSDPSGKRVAYGIAHDVASAPTKDTDGTVHRGHATCLACHSSTDNQSIRASAKGIGLGATLIAVVAEGTRRRIYLRPTAEQATAADVAAPDNVPTDLVTAPNHDVDRLPMYGMPRWCDAFTNRQLVALTTFSDLVGEARERVLADALAAGLPEGQRLVAGDGTCATLADGSVRPSGGQTGGRTEMVGAAAYADAVATFLGLIVSRITDYSCSISSWSNSPKNELIRNVFARQAIPMTWDFAEGNVFAQSAGMHPAMTRAVSEALERTPAQGAARVRQSDATAALDSAFVVSTDPPYYDNIGYSELSDFFYVWLRRALRPIHPELLSTLLVPKSEELVANPYRHGGKTGARQFFEEGFRAVFTYARSVAQQDYPITVYYAFKQSETDDSGTGSTGWETLLDGMIDGGWEITATWPMRSEFGNRMLAKGTNALASSIVLALRPRPDDAPATDRGALIAALHAELPGALRELQQGGIAPVDLPQAAIGPGMAVFSRYRKVIEADGSVMTVRAALQQINAILDEVLSEQEGDFSPTTRFAIAWYRQHGYKPGAFGDANSLAQARITAIDTLAQEGILSSGAGKVQLFAPGALPEDYDPQADARISEWEVLHHLIRTLETSGVDHAGQLLRAAQSRTSDPVDPDLVKELSYLLFRVAEANGNTQDALGFNTVVTSWPELTAAARSASSAPRMRQTSLDFDDMED